jgi:hypothetical protein
MNLLLVNTSLWYAPPSRTGSPADPSVRDTNEDDFRSAGIHTDDDDDAFMSIPKDDFPD